MPSSFPVPERCLLVQAAIWFLDRTKLPLPDEIYLSSPLELPAENSELRELFLVLKAENCDLRGDFVVEFTKHLGPNEAVESDCSRSISHLIDTEIVGMLNRKDIDFSYSKINSSSSIMDYYVDNKILQMHLENYPSEGRRIEYSYRNVTVDFSRLRTILSVENEDAQQPAKRGAPPKYNWDLIWAEIAVRADLDNLPSTQAECIHDISTWCIERFGEAPSDTTLKSKLKFVYGHHRKVGK